MQCCWTARSRCSSRRMGSALWSCSSQSGRCQASQGRCTWWWLRPLLHMLLMLQTPPSCLCMALPPCLCCPLMLQLRCSRPWRSSCSRHQAALQPCGPSCGSHTPRTWPGCWGTWALQHQGATATATAVAGLMLQRQQRAWRRRWWGRRAHWGWCSLQRACSNCITMHARTHVGRKQAMQRAAPATAGQTVRLLWSPAHQGTRYSDHASLPPFKYKPLPCGPHCPSCCAPRCLASQTLAWRQQRRRTWLARVCQTMGSRLRG
mmetsp:Transcript_13930/g.34326  ORF Transcript_13930/g.34326 Transcript_13930/m.34326 type:complete len:262 (+) Transcript_13930:2257-3042(+)